MASEILKERTKALKLEYITEIAQELFFQKGYEKTKVDEIAEKAGMSKSTLYIYAKSKENLFYICHIRGMKLRLQEIKERIAQSKSSIDILAGFASAYRNFYTKNPGYFKLHLFADYNNMQFSKIETKLKDEYTDTFFELKGIVLEALRSGVKNKELKDSINIEYTDKYFAFTVRTILNLSLNPDKMSDLTTFDPDTFYNQYLELFFNSIKR